MNKFLLISIFIFINLNSLVLADEKKCGALDLSCKTKKFIENTKEFQKKGLEKSKEQFLLLVFLLLF